MKKKKVIEYRKVIKSKIVTFTTFRHGLNQVENIILYNGPNNGQVLLSVEVKL